MLSPGPVLPEPGEAMVSSFYRSCSAWRTETAVRLPIQTLLPVAGRGCLHQTGKAAAAVRPVCSHRRCRVPVPRRQRRPAGRRRLGSESRSAGSAPLGLGARERRRERARGTRYCSEVVAVEAGSAAAALQLPSMVAVEDWRLGPYHQPHLSLRAAEEGEL